jgi:hypothetical protein
MDTDYAEFKYQAKFCTDKIIEMKKHYLYNLENKSGRFMELQLELMELKRKITSTVPQNVVKQLKDS